MLEIKEMIIENNALVDELDLMDAENDKDFYRRWKRYKELQNMIKLNKRAEKEKEISGIRLFITKNKGEILEMFNNKCEICGMDLKEILVVHHKTPISKGGTNEIDNLSVLCPNCHALVHKKYSKSAGYWIEENLSRNQANRLMKIRHF